MSSAGFVLPYSPLINPVDYSRYQSIGLRPRSSMLLRPNLSKYFLVFIVALLDVSWLFALKLGLAKSARCSVDDRASASFVLPSLRAFLVAPRRETPDDRRPLYVSAWPMRARCSVDMALSDFSADSRYLSLRFSSIRYLIAFPDLFVEPISSSPSTSPTMSFSTFRFNF